MKFMPSPPWKLPCPWCDFAIMVNARGQRGRDPGSGVAAAKLMEEHVAAEHGKTWQEFREYRRPFLTAEERREIRHLLGGGFEDEKRADLWIDLRLRDGETYEEIKAAALGYQEGQIAT